MTLTRKGWVVVGGVAFAIALLGLAFWTRDVREQKLRDGSVVRIEKVYFGKPEPFVFMSWLEQLKAKLPASLLKHFSKPPIPGTGQSSWYNNAPVRTNDDALYIYITRRDPLTGSARNVELPLARLVDEHGCILVATQAGGSDDGRLSALRAAGRPGGMGGMVSSVNWFRFEAFPRHERKFRLQLFEQGKNTPACEFIVQNPISAAPRKNWTAEPLPIKSSEGGALFVLSKVELTTNADPRGFPGRVASPFKLAPTMEVFEDGQPSKDWEALDSELYDSSGNFAGTWWGGYTVLCEQEEAWKLRVRYFASEKSHCASNVTWTLRGLTVPGDGEYTNLDLSQTLSGVTVKAVCFAGPGDFTYSTVNANDGQLLSASRSREPSDEPSIEWKNSSRIVHGKIPHLTISVSPMTDDQRLSVRAVDEKGREFYGYEWPRWSSNFRGKPTNGVPYLQKSYFHGPNAISIVFDLPADSKTVDLFICVHNACIPEFIFKPPAMKTAVPDAPAKNAASN